MTSFLVLVQMVEFREYTMKRLSGGSKNLYYGFPSKFPILFRFRSLFTYAIDDIINEQVTTHPLARLTICLMEQFTDMEVMQSKKLLQRKNGLN